MTSTSRVLAAFATTLFVAFFPSGLLADPVSPSSGYDDPAAISFTSTSNLFTNGSWSLGFEFSTNTAIDVTALGFFDATLLNSSDVGLGNCTGCGEVGIYNSSGTLLVSALVTTSGTQTGDFYYVSVPSTPLAAGQDYYAVAETGNADYTWFTTGFATSPGITFIADAFVSSTSLAFPTSSDGYTAAEGGGIFGANFLESPAVAAVPEPSSILLVVMGLGAIGLCALRKRRIA